MRVRRLCRYLEIRHLLFQLVARRLWRSPVTTSDQSIRRETECPTPAHRDLRSLRQGSFDGARGGETVSRVDDAITRPRVSSTRKRLTVGGIANRITPAFQHLLKIQQVRGVWRPDSQPATEYLPTEPGN